jgi:transposase
MDKYIGFDVDSKKTVACVISRGGKDVYATLPTDPVVMRRWLREQGRGGRHKLHLTFEVSGMSGWLYDELVEEVDELVVSNPSKMPWIFRTAKKNDRIDARKQALLLMMGEIPKVHMPSRAVRQWRGQIQHRRKLVNARTQVKNRIRAYLKGLGYRRLPIKENWWTRASHAWIREMFATDFILLDLLDQLDLLNQQIKRVTQRLDERLQHHAGGALLQTIPGVGPRTAEAVLAYVDEVERFGSGKQMSSYFGLTPKLDESGACRRLGHISKQGPSVARWLLVESGWRVIKSSESMWAFYEQVLHGQPNRKKIAVVAVANKLVRVMRAMLLTGECFNERLVLKQEQLEAVG